MIDFHNHFAGYAAAPDVAARWPDLADRRALDASLESVTRVISTPLEFIDGPLERCNDAMAQLVATQPRRLFGLATVDAYADEPAARELRRSVRDLGLRGVFCESAKGELFPDCAEAQATWAAAASLGVPVFLHPVPDDEFRRRFRSCGKLTERLSRSTVNSAAILAMIESGAFEKHRGLKVVVTALALGGLLLADHVPDGVYVDTTGTKPATLRAAIELLGPERVVAGSDWPVVREPENRLAEVLESIGVSTEHRARIADTNARELLRL